MKEYLKEKLKSIIKDIEFRKETIIKSAYNLDVKQIEENCSKLTILKDRYRELSKDVGNNLSVNECIELFNLKLVETYGLAYAFKYEREPITLNERDILSRLFYEFKDSKV